MAYWFCITAKESSDGKSISTDGWLATARIDTSQFLWFGTSKEQRKCCSPLYAFINVIQDIIEQSDKE